MKAWLCSPMVIGALFFASLASADDDASSKRARATALFNEGLALHDAHREAEANEKFRRAYELFPTPNALYLIARTEHEQKQHLAALRHYREALKNPLLDEHNSQRARGYIKELEPTFGRLLAKGPDGTKVTIDDREVRLPMDEPLDVEPHAVALRGTREGETYEGRADVVPGRVTTIELKRSGSADVANPPPVDGGGSQFRYIVPIGLGVLAIGTFIGGVAMASSSSKKEDEANTFRNSGACGPTSGPSCGRVSDLTDEASRKATWSYVLYGAAGVLAVSAAVVWFVWPKEQRKEARITPLFGQGFAGLSAQTQF